MIASVESSGIQIAGSMPDDIWENWYTELKQKLTGALGYEIGEPEDRTRLLYYVKYHDDHVSLRLKHLRRHLQMVGFEEFQKLMLLQVADAKAHVQIPIVENRIMICSALAGEEGRELYRRILDGE